MQSNLAMCQTETKIVKLFLPQHIEIFPVWQYKGGVKSH